MNEHRCEPPDLGTSVTISRVNPWECGICGRIWARGNWSWEEIRGPVAKDSDTPKKPVGLDENWQYDPSLRGWTFQPSPDPFHTQPSVTEDR